MRFEYQSDSTTLLVARLWYEPTCRQTVNSRTTSAVEDWKTVTEFIGWARASSTIVLEPSVMADGKLEQLFGAG